MFCKVVKSYVDLKKFCNSRENVKDNSSDIQKVQSQPVREQVRSPPSHHPPPSQEFITIFIFMTDQNSSNSNFKNMLMRRSQNVI